MKKMIKENMVRGICLVFALGMASAALGQSAGDDTFFVDTNDLQILDDCSTGGAGRVRVIVMAPDPSSREHIRLPLASFSRVIPDYTSCRNHVETTKLLINNAKKDGKMIKLSNTRGGVNLQVDKDDQYKANGLTAKQRTVASCEYRETILKPVDLKQIAGCGKDLQVRAIACQDAGLEVVTLGICSGQQSALECYKDDKTGDRKATGSTDKKDAVR